MRKITDFFGQFSSLPCWIGKGKTMGKPQKKIEAGETLPQIASVMWFKHLFGGLCRKGNLQEIIAFTTCSEFLDVFVRQLLWQLINLFIEHQS